MGGVLYGTVGLAKVNMEKKKKEKTNDMKPMSSLLPIVVTAKTQRKPSVN